MSVCYGIFLAPKTAWYPLSSRMFQGLGVLVQLGLSGIGKHSFKLSKYGPLLNPYDQAKRLQNGGLGNSWLLRLLSENSHQWLLSPMLTRLSSGLPLDPTALAAQSVLFVSESSAFQAPLWA